jgi:ribosome-associated protein
LPRSQPSVEPQPVSTASEGMPLTAPAPGPDPLEIARSVARAAGSRQGEDIQILDISKVSSFADYFVLVTGESERQVKAIAEAIMEAAATLGIRAHHVEGEPEARWILLDFVDVVVHIFLRELRAYYNIDRLWADAPQVSV